MKKFLCTLLFSSLIITGCGSIEPPSDPVPDECRTGDQYFYNSFTEQCFVRLLDGVAETKCSPKVMDRIIFCRPYVLVKN